MAPRPAPMQLRSSRGALLVRSGNVKVGDKAPDFSLIDQVGCRSLSIHGAFSSMAWSCSNPASCCSCCLNSLCMLKFLAGAAHHGVMLEC